MNGIEFPHNIYLSGSLYEIHGQDVKYLPPNKNSRG